LQARLLLKGCDIVGNCKYNRSRSYYRHQRTRVIAKKVYIHTKINGNVVLFPEGVYAKGKVHCSCKMCKYEKHFKLIKAKEESKLIAMQKEVEEFWKNGNFP
jgi:hypothetical protein